MSAVFLLYSVYLRSQVNQERKYTFISLVTEQVVYFVEVPGSYEDE